MFLISRNDGGILVYDADSGGAPPASAKNSSDLSSVATAPVKESQPASHPVVELATGETCHSLAWLRSKPTTIVAGMNGKSLKIFDIRVDAAGGGRASGGNNFTRAVYGVCIDPFLDVS